MKHETACRGLYGERLAPDLDNAAVLPPKDQTCDS